MLRVVLVLVLQVTAVVAGPWHGRGGGRWQRGRGLGLVAGGVASAFGRRWLIRRVGARLPRRLVAAAAAAVLAVQVGVAMGAGPFRVGRVA